MFGYNRFWHFLFRLDNRHYFRTVLAAVSIALTVSYFFFPFLLATYFTIFLTILAPSLVVGAVFTVLNKLSDYFYSRQQETLRSLKRVVADDCKFQDPEHPTEEEKSNRNKWVEDKLFNEQIDYYLGRREVCPPRLLAGQLLESTAKVRRLKSQFKTPPTVTKSDTTVTLTADPGGLQRNQCYEAHTSDNQDFFVKTAAAHHALSEIAANEIADIAGFGHVIPAATLTDNQTKLSSIVPSTASVGTLSSLAFQRSLDPNSTRPTEITLFGSDLFPTNHSNLLSQIERAKVKPIPGVERLVLKFITLMIEIHYKIKMRKDPQLQLLYIQQFVPAAQSGLEWFTKFFPSIHSPEIIEAFEIPEHAKKLLRNIDLVSFQENFLTQIVLGSGDCNPGNTLFVSEPGTNGPVKLYSIDHEDIMPEDNYNVTKKIPAIKDTANLRNITIHTVDNVFPMRIWLAGLPQADVPFSKNMMTLTLAKLDPQRLATYHRYKQLFSPKAVGAQLDRVNLIRALFAAELRKPEQSLTPKALFLKLINNHPTYAFLKIMIPNDLGLFMQLGIHSTDAAPNMLLRPLQYVPMLNAVGEACVNVEMKNTRLLSDETWATPYGIRATLFFQTASTGELMRTAKKSVQELEVTRKSLTMGRPS